MRDTEGVNPAVRLARAADRFQRQHAWLAFPVAVWKKFSEDRARNLAALLAYYAFASIFLLMLVLVTILDITLSGDEVLRERVTDAIGNYPVIGPHLSSVHPLRETGLALVIGLLGTLVSARWVANAAQNVLNALWLVPFASRPGFPWIHLRSLALIAVVGLGEIVTTVISGLVAGTGPVLTGTGARAAAAVVALALNVLLFWFGFRLATARAVQTRELRLGALIAATAWQALQLLGGYLVTQNLQRSSEVYGVFGVVLGLLAWLLVQAQITLCAVEINVVKVRRLWPRSLAPPPLTPQDMKIYRLYANAQKRHEALDIEIRSGAATDPADPAGPSDR